MYDKDKCTGQFEKNWNANQLHKIKQSIRVGVRYNHKWTCSRDNHKTQTKSKRNTLDHGEKPRRSLRRCDEAGVQCDDLFSFLFMPLDEARFLRAAALARSPRYSPPAEGDTDRSPFDTFVEPPRCGPTGDGEAGGLLAITLAEWAEYKAAASTASFRTPAASSSERTVECHRS